MDTRKVSYPDTENGKSLRGTDKNDGVDIFWKLKSKLSLLFTYSLCVSIVRVGKKWGSVLRGLVPPP